MKGPNQLTARLFAILSAICLVGAVAMATLFPPWFSLGQLVTVADNTALVWLQDFCHAHLAAWVWPSIAVPVLLRPCWLMPAALGLVTAGAAVSLSTRQGASRSRRKRS